MQIPARSHNHSSDFRNIMSNVRVCILVHGAPNYYAAAEQSVRSALKNSSFDLFLASGSDYKFSFKKNRRLVVDVIDTAWASEQCANAFLLKFHALQRCLDGADHELIMLMDADAAFARKVIAADIYRDLGDAPLGMVEQTRIIGSNMGRDDFMKHYCKHVLPVLDPEQQQPYPESFKYFNSGIVFIRPDELEKFLAWAMPTTKDREHQVGEHMVTDQDYFQFWANSLHPGRCRAMPWRWNHCEYWDDRFPRKSAKIVHFSNFCKGPADSTPERMARITDPLYGFRQRASGLINYAKCALCRSL